MAHRSESRGAIGQLARFFARFPLGTRNGHGVGGGGPTTSGLGVTCRLVRILRLLQLPVLTKLTTVSRALPRRCTMNSRLQQSACSEGPHVRPSRGNYDLANGDTRVAKT